MTNTNNKITITEEYLNAIDSSYTKMQEDLARKTEELLKAENHRMELEKQLKLAEKCKPALFVLQYLAHVVSSRVMRLIKR